MSAVMPSPVREEAGRTGRDVADRRAATPALARVESDLCATTREGRPGKVGSYSRSSDCREARSPAGSAEDASTT
jgi:hypothetical protein